MPQNNLLLFVYGTLRRDCATGAHRQYLQGAEWLSAAKIRGSLFLVDYYPGLVIGNTLRDADSHPWVQGEIYQLENVSQLHRLDEYEGCSLGSPRPHEYSRNLVDVTLENGQLLQVWTYVYSGDVTPLSPIASGDFLKP